MKYILVIETSDGINKPAIEYRIYSTEPFRKTRITGYRHLKPMPAKMEVDDLQMKALAGLYATAWNDCLKELEK